MKCCGNSSKSKSDTPLKVFIVYSHPESKSYNASVKDIAVKNLEEQGHQVKVSDLYEMKFKFALDKSDIKAQADPGHASFVMDIRNASGKGELPSDVKAEIEKVEWCDLLIFISPVWWGNVNSMLKSWIERVFACGKAWDFGKMQGTGPYRGKRALLAVTAGQPENVYTKEKLGMSLDEILHNITWNTFHFCGFDTLPSFKAYGISPMAPEEARKQYLESWKDYLRNIKNLKPIYPFKEKN